MFASTCVSFLLFCVPAAEASAEPDARVEQLEQRVEQLEALLDERGRAERWAQDMDGLIADALADARARESVMGRGVFAGIDETGKIFFVSGDGETRLDILGQIQVRYEWNNQDTRNAPTSGDSVSGFDVRRTKLKLFGKLPGGWTYRMIFATLRSGGPAVSPDTYTEMAQIGYQFSDQWKVLVGYFKLPFSRQEMISSSTQVAVDRGVAHEFFTLNFSEQVQLVYTGESARAFVALSDGANTTISGIPNATSQDFAVTARGEVKLHGDWSAGKTEQVDRNNALFLAAAVHYEKLDGDFLRNGVLADDTLVWTGEVLWKTPGLALSAAVFGSHVSAVGADRVDAFGGMLQVNALIDDGLDAFARYEILDDGGVADTNPLDDDAALTQAVTLGFNRHFGPKVRLTSDVIYVFAGNDPAGVGRVNGGALSGGIGLQPGLTDDDGQVAWRTQLQLLF